MDNIMQFVIVMNSLISDMPVGYYSTHQKQIRHNVCK